MEQLIEQNSKQKDAEMTKLISTLPCFTFQLLTTCNGEGLNLYFQQFAAKIPIHPCTKGEFILTIIIRMTFNHPEQKLYIEKGRVNQFDIQTITVLYVK